MSEGARCPHQVLPLASWASMGRTHLLSKRPVIWGREEAAGSGMQRDCGLKGGDTGRALNT